MLTKLMHASVTDETLNSQLATLFGDLILVCALKLLSVTDACMSLVNI